MPTYFKRIAKFTPTRLWINNVTPEEARLAIAAGAESCTQNPTYPYKMLTHPTHKAHALQLLDEIMTRESDDDAAQSALQLALVAEIAEEFLPVYEATHGRGGYVTIQADPFKETVEYILKAARAHCAAAPNIMAKIPAIPAGLEAMKVLLREGLPLLATEIMSVAQAMDCAKIYQEAYSEMAAPPVMYMAHIPGIFDEQLGYEVTAQHIDVPADYLHQGGVAVAKKIQQLVNNRGYAIGLCSGGARGLHHFTEMVGSQYAVTINWQGAAETLLNEDGPVCNRFSCQADAEMLDELCYKVPSFRKAYEIHGLAPEEYTDFGPVGLFRQNFEAAWLKGRELIAARRKGA